MSDSAAFFIASVVSWWLHAPGWVTIVFAVFTALTVLAELAS